MSKTEKLFTQDRAEKNLVVRSRRTIVRVKSMMGPASMRPIQINPTIVTGSSLRRIRRDVVFIGTVEETRGSREISDGKIPSGASYEGRFTTFMH